MESQMGGNCNTCHMETGFQYRSCRNLNSSLWIVAMFENEQLRVAQDISDHLSHSVHLRSRN